MSVSGSDIETAVEAALITDNQFLKVQIGRPLVNMVRPGVNAAVFECGFEVFGNVLKQQFQIILLLVVKNLVSESERRKAIHPLLLQVTRLLWGNELGLAIDPIVPTRWKETTTDQQVIDGLTVFEHVFTTKSILRKQPTAEELVELTEVWASYNIQPGDESEDASDRLPLGDP